MDPSPAGAGRPAAVSGGAETLVLWLKSEPVLPSLQSYVVVAAAPGMKRAIRSASIVHTARPQWGVVLPETEIGGRADRARARRRGQPPSLSIRAHGAIEQGTHARVSAKMP